MAPCGVVELALLAAESPLDVEREDVDLEELELDYEEKCNDVEELRQELHEAKIEVQQLELRVRGVAKATAQVCTPHLPQVDEPPASPDPRTIEMQALLQWLAEEVVLERPRDEFQVACDLRIGNRNVHVGHVAQWRLRSSGTDLKFSVPAGQVADFEVMLTSARAESRGNDSSGLLAVSARSLAEKWELVASEVPSPESRKPEPVVILVHRETSACALLATWPTAPRRNCASSMLPASQHALPLEPADSADEVQGGPVATGPCATQLPGTPATSPQHRCRTQSCPPRFGDTASLASNCANLGRHLRPLLLGDRVEVEYQGQWFAGQVCVIEDGIAHVHCDADPPGVLTRAAVQDLRRLHTGTQGE